MSTWTSTDEQYVYEDELGIFDFHNESPEAMPPDLGYSSQPLSRFSSSTGSSNQSNLDPQFPTATEPACNQVQYDMPVDQAGSATPYWGYEDSTDRFGALGAQFNPAATSPAFSTSSNFGSFQDQVPALDDAMSTPVDMYSLPEQVDFRFDNVPQTQLPLPDWSCIPPSTNAQSLSGSFDSNYEIPVTPIFPGPDQIPRRPKHARSYSSMERVRRAKRDLPLVCLHQGCNSKPFNRPADLDRHYLQIHGSDQDKKSWFCDYARCSRAISPFHRLDHCREHYREFHREDIDKRGVPLTIEWCQERNVKSSWWRCNKCLSRISVYQSGFQCSLCQYECPEVRQRIRGY